MHSPSRLSPCVRGLFIGLLFSVGLPATTWADQLILDDLIVDGSMCIGIDCVNNMSFGFDTIRLRENNLQIHFDDTSTIGAFPRNDWRIIINERRNGGVERFAIEDSTHAAIPFTIEANVAPHSLYVRSGLNGQPRVGIGTSTPDAALHIVSDDVPTVRLEQSVGGGFSPQTWDIIADESQFFLYNVDLDGVPFAIDADAPDDSFVLLDTGDVSIFGKLLQGSSRQLKDDLVSLDSRQVLDKVTALPVPEWSYTRDTQTRHIGPMAQDFHAAFSLGSDAEHLAPADTAGVALVAIQALDQQLKTLQEQKATLQRRNAELHARLATVRQHIARMKKNRAGEPSPAPE